MSSNNNPPSSPSNKSNPPLPSKSGSPSRSESSPKSKSKMAPSPTSSPKQTTKSKSSTIPDSSQRPYSLYWNKPVRKYSHNRNSLRQKSINLQMMSHSISQNLIDMKYKNKSGRGAMPPYTDHMRDSSSTLGDAETSALSDENGAYPTHLNRRQLPVELPTLPPKRTNDLTEKLNTFLTHHLSFHRPIALVTSGGTITTLERNTIRYLDNFSTGQRGAISVEEFCKRGYAVVHLWREGSAAPYSRVLSKLLGCAKGNDGLGPDALGLLFEGQQQQKHQEESLGKGNNRDELGSGGGSEKKKPFHDPWLTTTHRSQSHRSVDPTQNYRSNSKSNSTVNNYQKYSAQNRMNLTTHILHNNLLQRKLRERSDATSNNLLYTIPFTTIEEYIALLKIATEAMDQCQSLGLIYLAAAVSDFYIPEEDKCVHKIQSRDYGIETRATAKVSPVNGSTENGTGCSSSSRNAIVMNQADNTLSLTMQPVPKVIQHITQKWSPHAFCVSFKLETDENILRKKVQQAMKKYNVQLVIGNVLDTRHDKVSLFEQKRSDDFNDFNSGDDSGDGLKVSEVTKSNPIGGGCDDDDELENNIISNVVEKHFEYIANHYLIKDNIGDIDDDDDDLESIGGEEKNILPRTALMTGAEAAARHNAYTRKKKEALKRELQWKRLRDVSLNIAGHAIGCFLTFTLSSAVQTYLH